ncbi:MAG: hypothetical protein MK171_08430 [Pirellulales bacterium]|nr:hypothetical protein [Pirellulales bacterium]
MWNSLLWTKVTAGLYVACLATFLADSVCACNVPVFRYALQRWQPDPLEALVLHRGPLDEQHIGLVQTLEDVIGDDDAPANLAVRTVDLEQLSDDDAQELLEEAGAPEELPRLLVRYPPFTRTDRPAFCGPLNDSAVHALVDSPARRELVRRIGDGHSAVWVLVASGDRDQDEAAAQLLQERLRHLESTVDLSARDWYAPDSSLPPQPDTTATAQPRNELRLQFSVITVSRDDPAERAFVSMLINSEPDLYEFDEPIAIPVYGRGRAHFALVGQGIGEENIDDTCDFLAGACSCVIKAQNPGADMLIRVNWDLLVSSQDVEEKILPELTGLGAFTSDPEVEHDNTDTRSVAVAAAESFPTTSAGGSHTLAVVTPAPVPPTVEPSSTMLVFPVVGVVLLVLVVVVLGTLWIRSRGS